MSKRPSECKGKTILNYFKKVKPDSDSKDEEPNASSHQKEGAIKPDTDPLHGIKKILNNIDASPGSAAGPSCSGVYPARSPGPTRPTNETGVAVAATDIGMFLMDIKKIDNFSRYQVLTNHWTPEKDFLFPYSSHIKRGREEKRRANHGHFGKHSWLIFSKSKEGLFCKYCVLFLSDTLVGGQKTVLPRKLVTEPLVRFAKLTGTEGDLHKHEITSYHIEATEKAMNFILTYEKPQLDLRNMLSEERKKQVMENRARLVPIIKTIILHGQQNIPLRGHRDDGPLLDEDKNGDLNLNEDNDGCFRALLRFRVDSGDVVLKEHLKSAGAKATYISKTTANELITCCGDEILSVITKKIIDGGYYSIIFDETTDVANMSQLSISARYFSKGKIFESFLGFVELHKYNYSNDDAENSNIEPTITGKVLGETVIQMIKNIGIDIEKCVGIGCDGCSVNMSKVKGAAAEIQKQTVNSIICPCYNHALNLSLSKSVSVRSVKNTIGTIQEIVNFFNASAKRRFILKKHIKYCLSSPCQTRWVERHDSILEFQKDLSKIVKALKDICDWDDGNSSTKAHILIKAVCDCEFIITLCTLADIFSVSVPFSKYLQSKNIDVDSAKAKLKLLIQSLNLKRINADSYFEDFVLKESSKLMIELDIESKIPRVASRQIHRDNFSDVKDLTPNQYWKRVIFLPVLDSIITDLTDRFSEKLLNTFVLSTLLPRNLASTTDTAQLSDNLSKIIDIFGSIISYPSLIQLMGEVQLFKLTDNSADSAIEALQFSNENEFPIIHKCLKILCCLPVSVATAERSFSTLRILKTYLRSTITEARLNGLALLYVHRGIALDVEKIIDRFSKQKRKLDFII